MAEVPNSQGVPTVAPDAQAPDDYQRLTPAAAEGGEALGEGASKAGQFYWQSRADDQTNKTLDGMNALLYGTGQPVQQPDGTTAPDTGFFGKKGAAAMSAVSGVQQSMQALFNTGSSEMGTPEAKLQYDNFVRRYRAGVDRDIGSHIDQQSTAWASAVNTDSANVALRGIAQNAGDPEMVKNYTADLLQSRMKQAQLEGATPGDPVSQDRAAAALQDAAITQINAIGGDDPQRAVNMIRSYRSLLGPRIGNDGNVTGDQYTSLLNQYQEKADQVTGSNAGTTLATGHAAQASADFAASPTNPAQPVYQQAATAITGAYSASGLARTVQIESPTGKDNSIGMMGYGQFSKATWARFGQGDPHNLQDSVAAIQRYGAYNATAFQKAIGRPPTDAELYMMHQQGTGGGLALLSNPNANAARLVGEAAIVGNGGSTSMTAGQFTAMWAHKFNGTTPSANSPVPLAPVQSRVDLAAGGPAGLQSVPAGGIPPSPEAVATTGIPAAPAPLPVPGTDVSAPPPTTATPQAAAYQQIMDSDMTPRAKQYAVEAYNRQASALAIAADQSATQIRQANDTALNGYVTNILQGKFPTVSQIANDPQLTAEGKEAAVRAMQSHADDSAAGATFAYGSGYFQMRQQILAGEGDPSKISTATQILKAAGPGGPLTVAGANNLITMLGQVQKPDQAAIEQTKNAMLSYAKSKISFDTSGMPMVPGVTPHRDAQGEMLFNSRFVPKFEAAYSQWVGEGKNPWEFLTQDNIDKLRQGIRSPREMAMAQLAETTGVDPDSLSAPPAPAGADPEGWKLVVNSPPTMADGKPTDPVRWTKAVTLLQQQPTDDRIAQFNAFFGANGVTAEEVLDALAVQKSDPLSPDDRTPLGIYAPPAPVNPGNVVAPVFPVRSVPKMPAEPFSAQRTVKGGGFAQPAPIDPNRGPGGGGF